MTAAEAIIRAGEAGLTLAPDPGGLAVGGPKAARAALLPTLRPLADEILALLARPSPCVSGPDTCPTCGYIHGAMESRPPCNGCGRVNTVVTLVMDDGSRHCFRCLAGGPPENRGAAGELQGKAVQASKSRQSTSPDAAGSNW